MGQTEAVNLNANLAKKKKTHFFRYCVFTEIRSKVIFETFVRGGGYMKKMNKSF